MHPLVYDIIVNRYRCHTCGSRVSAEAPLPPRTAFGPSLASFVATMRMQAASFNKIAMLLKQFFSIRIGVATLQRIERWVADRLMPQYSRLKASLKSHNVNAGVRIPKNADQKFPTPIKIFSIASLCIC